MKATITSKGQITIPLRLRQKFHLNAGDELEFDEDAPFLTARRAINHQEWKTTLAEWQKVSAAALKDHPWESQRFEADFSGAWQYEAHDDFRRHLSIPLVTGCPITMVMPVGTTYEFMFDLKKRSSYGKILLTPDKKLIYIFSAHLPLKSKLSCE